MFFSYWKADFFININSIELSKVELVVYYKYYIYEYSRLITGLLLTGYMNDKDVLLDNKIR
jgi:hypothetical protein